ncbi:flavoprotein [Cytobacillus sp. NCCP-133]|jgi:phosphopantothenoylcysteine synthetase/decarboxylase|uniref:flavoprotein n=1 Tax=Cytobacillus sp. NCCP-133 TaxID=766848 RepID=UPI0022314C38|nr:flavoprotein [Cytobacillus sp. NCCP-133]GLB60014.1 hypothetical protein NCCP133_21460 [Cytobacillus sp. NCCP-133]
MEYKKILIGISGSIGAVEIHSYLTEIHQRFNCSMNIIMTESAKKIVNPDSLKYFVDGYVFDNMFDSYSEFKIPHVHLPNWADVLIILPATANIIGKIANGIADDLLATTAMAATCPVIIVPNTNEHMYNRRAVQRNIQELKEDGYIFIEPEGEGVQLSTKKKIKGAMPSPKEFVSQLEGMILHA